MLLETIIGLLSGLGGALGGIASLWAFFRRPVDSLKERVQRIEDEQLRELRADLKAHIENDQSQRMLAMLENITGNLAQVNLKLDSLASETSRQAALIEGDRKYIENLDKAFQRHTSQPNGHQ